MTPGNAMPELGLRPDPAFRSNLDIITHHLRFAPFRFKGFAVDDAATGERLAGPFLTEGKAERVRKSLKKQYPSAFIQSGAD